MPTDSRLAALAAQLVVIHDGLREMLAQVRAELEGGGTGPPNWSASLQEHCLAFCGALEGHHQNEDGAGFAIAVELAPQLRPVIEEMRREHLVIAGILRQLQKLLTGDRPVQEIKQTVDGLAALLESHFGYEERKLNAAAAGAA